MGTQVHMLRVSMHKNAQVGQNKQKSIILRQMALWQCVYQAENCILMCVLVEICTQIPNGCGNVKNRSLYWEN